MLTVALHRIESATVIIFESGGKTQGAVEIKCREGDEITLYTTPTKAQAIADAVNQTEKPSWTISDLDVDLSDVWIEECDPENEIGAVCTGHFRKDFFEGYDMPYNLELRGVTVNDGSGPLYYDREWLEKTWRDGTVQRVEAVQTELEAEK